MKSFSRWLEEKKKKEKEPAQTTPTSAPLRGQNQDQSGSGVKHDVADYTISDEKVPDSWEDNTPAERMAAVKKLMKLNLRHGAVHMPHYKIKEEKLDELVSGTGKVRTTPVNIGSTPRSGSADAPKTSGALQHSADARRAQLDKTAQQQRDMAQKDRENEIKNRQKEAEQRAKQSASKAPKPPQQTAEGYIMNVTKKLASHVGKKFLDGAVGKTTSDILTSTPIKNKPTRKSKGKK